MKVICFPIGPLASNCYVVSGGDHYLVIDPSVSPDKVSGSIEGFDHSKVKAILITHGHNDHICMVNEWITRCPEADVYMSSSDDYLLSDPVFNCSYMTGRDTSFSFKYKESAGEFMAGDLSVSVIATPGHTKGSVCYKVCDGESSVLFTGDTLFAGSMGRTDMEGGSPEEMIISLSKLAKLPVSLPVLPGHGNDSTIGIELDTNPYLIN